MYAISLAKWAARLQIERDKANSRFFRPTLMESERGHASESLRTERLLNQALSRQKVVYALTKIKGVGRRYSNLVWYAVKSISQESAQD
jgi:hypothetical protein